MIWAMRVVVGLIGLFFLVFGLRFVFTPADMAAAFLLAPDGIGGLSNIRGDLGGAFLAVAVFTALGLRPGGAHWLYAAATVNLTIAAARIVGFLVDGTTEAAVTAFMFELVFAALLVIAGRRLSRTPPPA